MAKTKKNEYIQYSKRLATWVTIIWFLLSTSVIVAAIIRPETAESLVAFLKELCGVEVFNIGLYTGNSVGEKGLTSWFNRKTEDEKQQQEDAAG